MSEVRDDTMRHVGAEVAPRTPGPRTPEVAPPGHDASGDSMPSHDGSPEVAPRGQDASGESIGQLHDGTPEVGSPRSVEAMVARLTALDATLDEVEMVRKHWDDPWEPGAKEAMFALSDVALMAEIRGPRDEFEHDTLTEDEQADVDFRRSVDALRPEAENQASNGSVDTVLAWVEDDPAKAQAALEAEQALPEPHPRKTLVAQLEKIAGVGEGQTAS